MDARRESFLRENMGDEWYDFLKGFMNSKMDDILDNLNAKAQEKDKEGNPRKIYPSINNLFLAYRLCPPSKLKVILLGQDPYHSPEGAAHGLAFSSGVDNYFPPSLRVMFDEISRVTKEPTKNMDRDLTRWSKQGVLLANTHLTVFEKEAKSHEDVGWESFTGYMLSKVDMHLKGVVRLLLGKEASKTDNKYVFPFNTENASLVYPHPAAQLHSGGKISFVGSGAFQETNRLLSKFNKKPIEW